jgi:hypothetical protein
MKQKGERREKTKQYSKKEGLTVEIMVVKKTLLKRGRTECK